jgi:oxygen-independent coproporphyrinogen-3 oxidase
MRERKAAMVPAGLYFHIPFCKRKCPYCDFYSQTELKALPDFLAALYREMVLRTDPALPVDSVYFGGGTPSLCPPEAVASLLATIEERFDLLCDAEVTLEANPGAIDADALLRLRQAGVNRLNLGVQSFRDDALQFLGRIHTRDAALATIAAAREAGFDNLGLDLIYGLPGQDLAAWRRDLEQALEFQPEHLSCYILTFEAGTPMAEARQAGRIPAPDEAQVAALFEATAAVLTGRGYDHYEIANFARQTTYRSRHNMKYWQFAPYLGFGPSAHSFRAGVRSWNAADLALYCRRLAEDRLPEDGREELTVAQQMLEALLLGLRLKEGFSIAAFEEGFGISVSATFGRLLDRLTDAGCLAVQAGRCALTVKGMRYHDSIAARFAAHL